MNNKKRSEEIDHNDSEARLLDALNAGDDMLIEIFRHDAGDPLLKFAHRVQKLLHAESCALFRVDNDFPARLRLVSQSSDNGYKDAGEVLITVRSVKHGSLTGHLAKKGKVVALYGKSLGHHPYAAGNLALHLRGPEHSLLTVPLKSRKNQLLGLIKVQNKKDSHNRTSGTARFSREDLVIARTLANRLELAFETSHILTSMEELMSLLARSVDGVPALADILRVSMQLIRSNRGDLALVNPADGELYVVESHGPTFLKRRRRVPRQSVIGEVWKSGIPIRFRRRILYKGPYSEAHPRTRSEVAVPIFREDSALPPKRIGVLNAESFSTPFDQSDQALLQVVADSLAKLIDGEGARRTLGGALEGLASRLELSQNTLANHLKLIREAYGFDSGLIYLADETAKVLRLAAQMGCDDLAAKPGDYTHKMDQKASLAAWAYRLHKPLFSKRPPLDPRVYKSGLKTFRVKGPMLGLPLIHSERVLGVLMIWSRTGTQPASLDAGKLMPFAHVTAAIIAKSFLERELASVLDDAMHHLIVPAGNLMDLAVQLEAGQLQEPRKSVALQDLKSTAERILRLIDLHLKFARYKKNPLRCVVFCLRESIHRRVMDFKAEAGKCGITLEIDDTTEGEMLVFADRDRIEIVFDNLIQNAIKYSDPVGIIFVTLKPESIGYRWSVSDNGEGVEECYRSQIFERGFSIPPRGEASGTGLGLAISRDIMLDHGGTIEYQPNRDRGSIFTCYLPKGKTE